MPRTETEEALSRVPFFADLSRRDLRRLAALCVPKTFKAGAVILQEGAVGLGLFLITGGRVEVFKTEDGRQRELAELGAGDVLGEMALIDAKPRSASAVALEPTTALLLSRDSFRIVVKKSPAIAWALVPELAGRLREVEDRLMAAESRADHAAVPAVIEPPLEEQDNVRKLPSCRIDGRRIDGGQIGGGGLPQALLASAKTGLAGPWRVFRRSSRAFGEAMDVGRKSEPMELLTRLPRGTLAAAVSSMAESGKVARDMMSSFFDHLNSDDERGDDRDRTGDA